MRIEKITIDEENVCSFEDREWDSESGEYKTIKHTGIGYKIGYTTICDECFQAICEGKKVLDANKRIKSLEV